MEAEWKGVNLEIVEYRETQTYVLKGFDEIQQLLDDHIVMTQSMSFSPFKGPFAQRIDEWEKLLVLMSDIFEEWLKCQVGIAAAATTTTAAIIVVSGGSPAVGQTRQVEQRRGAHI